jgi:ubiquinone/menaquinone biosynthesis C-methylase UbiE
MNHPSLATQIRAAAHYEEAVVSALIREWAPRVLEAAGIRPRDRVLEVACGTAC